MLNFGENSGLNATSEVARSNEGTLRALKKKSQHNFVLSWVTSCLLPDRDSSYTQDLIADVEGVVKNGEISLTPSGHPEAAKKLHKGQGPLTISLSQR